ncbi:MAG: hypothetical protein HC851_24750 [Acaryochloris sp. RU_4_1]|nr:hypothetical protein [Acaryochloris sp. RU_4_1]
MPLLIIEEFVANPDWSWVPPHQLDRAQELTSLILAQNERSQQQQDEEYYRWILELIRVLGG